MTSHDTSLAGRKAVNGNPGRLAIPDCLESGFENLRRKHSDNEMQTKRLDKLYSDQDALTAWNKLADIAKKGNCNPAFLLIVLLNECINGIFDESSKLTTAQIKANCEKAEKLANELSVLIKQTEPLQRITSRLLESDQNREDRNAVAAILSPLVDQDQKFLQAYKWVRCQADNYSIADALGSFSKEAVLRADYGARHPKPNESTAERNALIGSLCWHCQYVLGEGRLCYNEVGLLIKAIYGGDQLSNQQMNMIWRRYDRAKGKSKETDS